jgi:DNA polymerase-3 subunit beta
MVATDGHRLALADAAHSSRTKLNVLMPERCVAELEAALAAAPHDEVVELTVSSKTIHCTTDSHVLGCKLGEYAFPAYDRVIPTEEGRVVEVDRQALAESLAAVRVAADSTAQVLFAVDRGALRLRAESVGEKAGEDELDVSYDGERFEIALNAAYVLDVLRALGGKRVRLHVLSERDPVRIVDPEDPSVLAIVMPMRR